MMRTIILIILWGLIALVPANVAKNKGRNFSTWYLYGFLLWPIALIHIACLPNLNDLKNKTTMTHSLAISNDIEIDTESPIKIISYEIVKLDNDTIGVKFAIANLEPKEIIAIKFDVTGRDSFNNIIEINGCPQFDLLLQDLHIFGQTKDYITETVQLPDKNIRDIKVIINSVKYSDNSIVQIDKHNFISATKTKIDSKWKEAAKSMIPSAEYYPRKEQSYWICSCGNVNSNKYISCNSCRNDIDAQIKLLSQDNLELKRKELLEKKAADQLAEEQKKIELEAKNKKLLFQTKKYTKIILPIIIVIILGIFATVKFGIPEYNYRNADVLVKNEEFEEAIIIYTKLGDYRDSDVRIRDARAQKKVYDKYQEALKKYKKDNYYGAFLKFKDIDSNYKACSEYKIDCQNKLYAEAMYNIEIESYDYAIRILELLDDFKDSQDQLTKVNDLKAQALAKKENEELINQIINDYKSGQIDAAEEKINLLVETTEEIDNIKSDIENFKHKYSQWLGGWSNTREGEVIYSLKASYDSGLKLILKYESPMLYGRQPYYDLISEDGNVLIFHSEEFSVMDTYTLTLRGSSFVLSTEQVFSDGSKADIPDHYYIRVTLKTN